MKSASDVRKFHQVIAVAESDLHMLRLAAEQGVQVQAMA
jgi:hypothetical protein